MQRPTATPRPHRTEHHGVTLVDPYYWLRDPDYPEVNDPEILEYLAAENAYFSAQMKPHAALVDRLFEEAKARQPVTDESVPYRRGNWVYRWRYPEGAQYQVWERAPIMALDQWQVMLDENECAARLAARLAASPASASLPSPVENSPEQQQSDDVYFQLGALRISPNGRYLAWSADTTGNEHFTLMVRDLGTGFDLPQNIPDTYGSPQWAADSATLFYVALNDQWRPYQIRAHYLDTPIIQDPLIFEESDEGFRLSLDQSQSQCFLFIVSGDHVTTEVHTIDSSQPTQPPKLISPRQAGHQYQVDHGQDSFFILTNDEHRNFRLVEAPEHSPHPSHWKTLIPGSDEHYLTGHLVLKHHLIISQRIQGLDAVRIIDRQGNSHYVDVPEESYVLGLGANAEYDTQQLRLHYESMVTPETVFDYKLSRRHKEILKIQEIPSGYDPSLYTTERLMAPARDGVLIPISLVYRKDRGPGPLPLYLYGYGAYGYAVSPGFSTTRLSLLDRGMGFAIAHIRGGDDMGYHWYEAGKLERRTNTFNDFVDVAHHLIHLGLTVPGRIAISGGSAGGELMAAAVNQAPELWGAVVAHVPFVDVLNTMLDATLPLTPAEWPEWGNPIEDADAFELIRSYSPYDQLKPGEYPPMLVTAGLNDPRVTYWEPAKYVAKIRSMKTDHNWLLLKTEMKAGHGGKSGRFESLKEVAQEYAFIFVSLQLETD